jgi:NADH-quinone oxidoreductase subunit E
MATASALTGPKQGHYGADAVGLGVLLAQAARAPRSRQSSPHFSIYDMAFALSADDEHKLVRILARYPNKMAACIPVLHLCQEANGNWVSEEVIAFVAEKLGLSAAHVKGVVTFYHLFNQSPPGKHQVWVCRTLSCALRGSDELIKHCEKRLGVHVGGTTADGKVTLRTAECLASCGTAPMMQVDKQYHENLNLEQVDQILDRLLAD